MLRAVFCARTSPSLSVTAAVVVVARTVPENVVPMLADRHSIFIA
jgi:hypothetical protein